MNPPFQLTPQAVDDLDAIWWFIAEDDRDAANRVELEIAAACRRLARYPRIGNRRPGLTPLPVRFWTIPKFPNYVIVYRSDTTPLQIVAILHGKRDLKKALEGRG